MSLQSGNFHENFQRANERRLPQKAYPIVNPSSACTCENIYIFVPVNTGPPKENISLWSNSVRGFNTYMIDFIKIYFWYIYICGVFFDLTGDFN